MWRLASFREPFENITVLKLALETPRRRCAGASDSAIREYVFLEGCRPMFLAVRDIALLSVFRVSSPDFRIVGVPNFEVQFMFILLTSQQLQIFYQIHLADIIYLYL